MDRLWERSAWTFGREHYFMCATYRNQLTKKQWKELYNVDIDDVDMGIDKKFVPFSHPPILLKREGELIAENAQFSLIPFFSDTPKPKFATFNARVETVDEKATWKTSWKKYHAIAPITNFIEPIYTGKYAGNMVSFDSEDVLHAASIYNDWKDRATKKIVSSFALLMRDGLPFVQAVGHERSPLFLKDEAVEEWLDMVDVPSKDMKNFLFNNLATPKLTVSIDRPMAKGWEKRIPKE